MTKKPESTLKFNSLAASILPGTGALAVPTTLLTRNGRPPTRQEEYISQKLRTDLTLQVAVAVKGEHGARLAQTLSVRTVQRFDEYVAFERAIRDQPRTNEADQADVEAFCQAVRQGQCTSLLAIRQATLNKIEEIILTPIDPPDEVGEEVIVEQKPGLLGWLFGGQQVTRVLR